MITRNGKGEGDMSDCVFCRIVNGEIPANVVYEDDHLMAFHDLNPQAPVHLLIIPKEHITDATTVEDCQTAAVGRLLQASARVAKQLELDGGYRLVTNVGADAGQTVMHLHIHLLGGRKMGWPPG